MKLVTAVRHAKSDWSKGLPDIARPLNRRGARNAPEMGRRLRDSGVTPDIFISSPAVRALSTAQAIAAELGYPDDEIAIEEDLYGAGPATMYAVLGRLPSVVGHAIFFTHNPGITDFANTVAVDHIDNIPTCGVITLEFDIADWSDIDRSSGKVVSIDYPRKTGT